MSIETRRGPDLPPPERWLSQHFLKIVLIVAIVVFAYWAVGRAIDHELAGAQVPPPVVLEQPGYRYQGRTAKWWAKRAVQARRDANARGRTIVRLRRELWSREIGPTLAIRVVFGEHADAALRVAWCESRWWPGAQNGQYLGLFQVSAHWRRTIPGFGATALEQAQHAYRVFVATGYSWSHWECRP